MRVSATLGKILLIAMLGYMTGLLAQPKYDSKKQIVGIHVFSDATDPLLFYYEPGELQLSRNEKGKPDFQFLDMRYTGTKCYNDQGDKSFMSLLQFGVEMKTMDSQTLKTIRRQLKNSRAKLVPLPISHINTQFVITSIKDNEEKKMAKEGTLEANGKEGYTTSRSFWKRRTFTVKLNKFESQALNKQLTKKLLGVSLGYAYSADFKREESFEAKGSEELLEALPDMLKNVDEVVENKIVKSDVLTIHIDIEKYPSIIKRVDLNEGIPPAYAGIEIRCNDFTDELRPDLYLKIVEIEAESVDNQKSIKIETKFSKKQADLNARHISFPYAIYVDTPMRYRVTEININGDREIFEWKEKPTCGSVINVTTPPEEQNIEVNHIEVELNRDTFFTNDTGEVSVQFFYVFNEAVKSKEIVFKEDESLAVQSIKLVYDKDVPIYYKIKKVLQDSTFISSEPNLLEDDYILLSEG